MRLGYTLVYVDDVPKTLAFYTQAFGLMIGFLDEGHQYGELVTGDTKLGFVHHETAASHGFDYETISPTLTLPRGEGKEG